jgi:hypothetical protein
MWAALAFLLVVCVITTGCKAAAGSCPSLCVSCMPAPSEHTAVLEWEWAPNTVVFNLGAGAGADVRWNSCTTVPTLESFAPLRALAALRRWAIDAWFFDDGAATVLEAVQGRWRPAIAAIALRQGWYPRWMRQWPPSMRTCGRTSGPAAPSTHRLSILTCAVWKGCLPQLLPMLDDLLLAYIWDSLAFEALARPASSTQWGSQDPWNCWSAPRLHQGCRPHGPSGPTKPGKCAFECSTS